MNTTTRTSDDHRTAIHCDLHRPSTFTRNTDQLERFQPIVFSVRIPELRSDWIERGKRIKDERISRRIILRDAAILLGIDVCELSQMERGVIEPDDDMWNRATKRPALMTPERYHLLSESDDPEDCLTEEEIAAGWHYCYEFDGLLVGPGMDELECCQCRS